jgi:hypothetical protein
LYRFNSKKINAHTSEDGFFIHNPLSALMYAKMTFYSWRRYTYNLFEKFAKLHSEGVEFFENSLYSFSDEREMERSELESKNSSVSPFSHSRITSFQPSVNLFPKEEKIFNTPEDFEIIE